MQISTVTYANLITKPLEWIWPEWIAKGAVHILAGEPGAGKSSLAMHLAAQISSGGSFPDQASRVDIGRVLIYASEDLESTVKARLLAEGADLRNVETIVGNRTKSGTLERFVPSKHLPLLRPYLTDFKPTLVILDPIVGFTPNQSGPRVREFLEFLAEIARESGSAILGITHLAKGSAHRPFIERIINSQAYAAVPRLVLAAGKDVQEDRNIFARVKSNISSLAGGYVYEVQPTEVAIDDYVASATHIEWGSVVEGEVTTLFGPETRAGRSSSLQRARDFLSMRLAQEAVDVSQIQAEAKVLHISETTLKRAKTDLGVLSSWEGRQSMWSLGAGAATPVNSHDAHGTLPRANGASYGSVPDAIDPHGLIDSHGLVDLIGLVDAPGLVGPDGLVETDGLADPRDLVDPHGLDQAGSMRSRGWVSDTSASTSIGGELERNTAAACPVETDVQNDDSAVQHVSNAARKPNATSKSLQDESGRAVA